MIGRRSFVAAGMTTAAMAAMGRAAFAQVDEHSEHGDDDKSVMEACAKACSDCQRACDSCSTHCAKQVSAGKKEHLTTLMTCQDCADFCVAASQIVSRRGPFSEMICAPCADACAACAKECEKFPEDKHMAMCAEECRECEKACRAVV
jgi:hypothetical protein